MSTVHFLPLLFISTLSIVVISGLEGFLDGGSCKEPQDCYILDDVNQGLWLACWSNVGKCKCSNVIYSDYTLVWKDGKCEQSKYGPCGKKGLNEVGCQDGFQCLNNTCVDPVSPTTIKPVPFVFDKSCNSSCAFSRDLKLDCDQNSGNCMCRKYSIMDRVWDTWDLRNYDGSKICSAAKGGPCGNRDGIEIECHEDGVTCQNGKCV